MSTHKRLAAALAISISSLGALRAQEMILVDSGESRAPIVVAANAPEETLRAANELAAYIERIAGARPDLLQGTPDPAPDSAIWIGLHPQLTARFPDTDFDFARPEEILLVCDGRNLAIVGRDRIVAGHALESGTANAVYTFLERYLDVRWLWPGPLGEDVPERSTIALPAFTYRFAPPFRQRRIYHNPGDVLRDWCRRQRILLDSLVIPAGHAFTDWWDRYHETQPEYFALQPDGSRGGGEQPYPRAGTVKLCETEPGVWRQWLENAVESLRDPTLQAISAAPNDGSNAGICMCERCRAWDHPDGRPWNMRWRDHRKTYVAMTDRYVRFWNQLAGMLAEAAPDRDVLVAGMAYGPARPPPIAVELKQNIVIGYVGHFPVASDGVREREKEEWALWADKAPKLIFRPNLFWYSGGMLGLPTLVTRNTMEDFRFLAEHSGLGVTIDTTPRFWAAQGPQYYVMAQFAWDPFQDGEALLDDYYRRGFGPAADAVAAYFSLMEETLHAMHNRGGWRHSMGAQRELVEAATGYYDADLFQRAEVLLDRAAEQVASGPQRFRDRVDFVRTGLDFARLQIDAIHAMRRVRESRGEDVAAVQTAQELHRRREAMYALHEGVAVWHWFRSYARNRGVGRGMTVEDLLGPPRETHLHAAGVRQRYRWTGATGDGDWHGADNWAVEADPDAWVRAETVPGREDEVILDDTAPHDRRRLRLAKTVEIGMLIVSATDGPDFRLEAADDAADTPALRLSFDTALVQSPECAVTLTLRVPLQLTHLGNVNFQLESHAGARVVLDAPVTLEAGGRHALNVRVGDGVREVAGGLEIRAPVDTGRFSIGAGAHVWFNTPQPLARGTLIARDGMLWLMQDAKIDDVHHFSATLAVQADAEAPEGVLLHAGSLTRGGHLRLEPDGRDARQGVTVSVQSLHHGAPNSAAPRVSLASGTTLDLRGNQTVPLRADRAAGIHGAGRLVKSESRGRGVAPVGDIGDRNHYTGGTFIEQGGLRLVAATVPVNDLPGASQVQLAGSLGPGPLLLAKDGFFDLNGLQQTVTSLHGEGTVRLNGGRLIVEQPMTESFQGRFEGEGELIVAGEPRDPPF